MTFYENDKVTLIDKCYDVFKETLGVTEWVVDHVKTPTKKNGRTLVVCYPIKDGRKCKTMFQFTKEQLKKIMTKKSL